LNAFPFLFFSWLLPYRPRAATTATTPLPQLFRGLAMRTQSCLLDGEKAPLPEDAATLLQLCPGGGGVLFTRKLVSPATAVRIASAMKDAAVLSAAARQQQQQQQQEQEQQQQQQQQQEQERGTANGQTADGQKADGQIADGQIADGGAERTNSGAAADTAAAASKSAAAPPVGRVVRVRCVVQTRNPYDVAVSQYQSFTQNHALPPHASPDARAKEVAKRLAERRAGPDAYALKVAPRQLAAPRAAA
jgi:hypothetical protein